MPDTLSYLVRDGVAIVTLNRPEAMNALNDELKAALRDALVEAGADPVVRCVVLTGSGRAFCVGQDLTEHVRNLENARTTKPDTAWATVLDHYVPIATALATMPKPVVAAVNGVAAGAGAAFAFACDFRIAAETAAFNMAFTSIGLCADSGSTWTLPRLVGMAKAKQLLMLSTTIKASEALEIGLATQVVEPGAVLPTALELARELAAGPTAAYGAIRRALAFSATHELGESLTFEAELLRATGATDDHRHAVQSFAAKEQPRFEGR